MASRIARPDTAFPLSQKRKRARVHGEGHLAWIRTLPCLVGKGTPVEAAHIRYGSAFHGKRETGMGERPSDQWTVPLSAAAHREQHAGSETQWWRKQGIDPLTVAALLYASSGDTEAAQRIIHAAQSGRFQFKD